MIAILILIIIAIAILLYYVLSIKSEKSPNKTKKVTGRVINIHSNKMLNDIKVNSFVLLRKFSDNSQTI